MILTSLPHRLVSLLAAGVIAVVASSPAAAQSGMMVMADVDQGNTMKMVDLNLRATIFLVGNPTVGRQVFERDPAA